MSRYLYPGPLLSATGALRLAGLAGVRAPAPRESGRRPGRPGPVPGCGCRVDGRAVVLCERHFAGLAGRETGR